jgi:hypothetical protein
MHTARRLAQYIGAVVRHFYLVGTAVLLTFLPFLGMIVPSQSFKERIDAFAASVPNWNRWPALLFAFLATFLAWKEEREARERAEKASPEQLRDELENIKAELDQRRLREWPRLTDEQKSRLSKALGQIGSPVESRSTAATSQV